MSKLRIDSVTKSFGSLVAVNSCSLEIRESAIYGLVGPNGSGKTTLFNLITGYLSPDAGKIFYGENEITKKSPSQIAHLGLVRTFQLSRVFSSLTVRQNVEVSRNTNTPKEKVDDILSLFGLLEIRNLSASKLSYGQRKLLDLARALIMNPQMLLLDEPLAGLEPSIIEKMTEQIRHAKKEGKYVFIIEHNMSVLMSLADKIFVLHNGRKIGEGSPQEISKMQEVLDAYLGTKARAN